MDFPLFKGFSAIYKTTGKFGSHTGGYGRTGSGRHAGSGRVDLPVAQAGRHHGQELELPWALGPAAKESLAVRVRTKLACVCTHRSHLPLEGRGDVDHVVDVVAHLNPKRLFVKPCG